MHSLKTINMAKKNFCAFLSQNGAEVLEPTNEWEVIRFNAGDITSVIYRKQNGSLTFTGEALDAFQAFKDGKAWRAMPRSKREKKSSTRMQAIRERDGDNCFYCLEHVSVADESEEHLVALTHGGPYHISNMFLAHKICNERVGHLSSVEKIQIHVAAHVRVVMQVPEKKIATFTLGDVLLLKRN